MKPKHILTLIILFFNTIVSFAQVLDSNSVTASPIVKIVHNNGILAPHELDEHKPLIIRLKNQEESIKGKFTFINDSTLTVGCDTVRISDIQTISIVNKNNEVAAGVLLGLGAAFSGAGILAILSIQNTESIVRLILLIGAGTAGLLAGTFMSCAGAIVLITASRKYDLDKWHIYMQYDT